MAQDQRFAGHHIIVRIHPRWGFDEVRRAVLALSREIERRVPVLATSKWWKEERHGVFSITTRMRRTERPRRLTRRGRFRMRASPRRLTGTKWRAREPADSPCSPCRQRFADVGDRHAGIDEAAGSLDALLEMAARDESVGMGDARAAAFSQDGRGGAARRPLARKTAAAKKPPRTKMPLITVAHSQSKDEALAGLERWRPSC